MQEEEIIRNLKKCPRFDSCSANLCPLDPEAHLRSGENENKCPFTIKKKSKDQKGIKTLASPSILEFIPKSNLKMLSRRNQKRWSAINKN
jgi:hypothetical protein